MKRTVWIAGLCLLVLGVAPGSGAGKNMANGAEPLSLEFSLSRSGNTLHIEYTVHNHGKDKVYLLDQMTTAGGGGQVAAPQAIIVQGEGDGVLLTRGYVDPGHPVMVRFAPGGRGLAPGQGLSGSAEVALPFKSWHPFGHLPPIQGTPASVTLQIGYVPADVQWTRLPLKDGGSLTVPTLPTVVPRQRFVRAGPKPIPAAP